MMNRLAGWRILTTVLLAMTAPVPRAAAGEAETVVTPFGCAIEQGRLSVTPGAPQALAIIGARASHAFTTCASGKPQRCQTWTVHKFDVSCGGERVAWMALLAASLEAEGGRARIVDGRFTLRAVLGSPQQHGGGAAGREDASDVTFPVGFAPALGVPIRFVATSATAPAKPVLDVADSTRPVGASGVVRIAAGPADVTLAVAPIAPAIERTGDVLSATLQAVDALARALGTSRDRLGTVALALTFAWGLLFVVRRRVGSASRPAAAAGIKILALPPPAAEVGTVAEATAEMPRAAEPASAATAGEGDLYAAHCAGMVAEAVALHRSARDALPAIGHASLRAVLQDDLDKVQAVLLTPRLTADIAAGLWASVEITVADALVNLDRVGRIIDTMTSTSTALPTRRAASPPATAIEAFNLLGVAPSASPLAVKKIVDGLRQSWHPDHAKDDTDRSVREARMKQINIAWDLIQNQPKAA